MTLPAFWHALHADHLAPKGVSGANRYASLVGNLPSHISIFGSDGGQGGRALSGGADEAGLSQGEDGNGAAGMDGARAGRHGGKRGIGGGVELPSHISIFGSSNHDLDDADMSELARLHNKAPARSDSGLGLGAVTLVVTLSPGRCVARTPPAFDKSVGWAAKSLPATCVPAAGRARVRLYPVV